MHPEAESQLHQSLSSSVLHCPKSMAPPTQRGRWGRAWHSFTDFNIVSLFQRAPPPRTPRTIYVQEELPLDFYNVKKNGKKIIKKEHIYTTNQVITSKYTILTFLPRNLLEQFRRVANMCVLRYGYFSPLEF